MLRYGGIDLHANHRVIVFITEQDEVLSRQRGPNELRPILEQGAPYHTEMPGLVVASPSHWDWGVDGLREAAYRGQLAPPAAMQPASGLTYPAAHSDARWGAHVWRLAVLPEGYSDPTTARAVRALGRPRVHVVRQHPATVRSVHNLRARNPGARFSGKRLQEWPTQDLPSWLTEEPQVLAVPSRRVVWDCLQQPIKTRDKTLPQRLKHPPAYEPLLTVQGLGTRLAHTLTLATGAISRLPTGGPSASSCRCVDRTQISHGKRKGTGPGTHGHPYVAWASLEAAQFAMRCQPAAQRFAQRTLAKSRNHTGWARAGYDRMRDLVPCEATQALG